MADRKSWSPSPLKAKAKLRTSRAQIYHDRIKSLIEDFINDELAEDEHAAVTVVLNGGKEIAAREFGFYNPYTIVVWGVDSSGNNVKILLPYTDIQLVISKTDKVNGREAREIGFQHDEK